MKTKHLSNKQKILFKVFLLFIGVVEFTAMPSIVLASLDDPTDSSGIVEDSQGRINSGVGNQDKNNTPVIVTMPPYSDSTGGGATGGRVDTGTPSRGNYRWNESGANTAGAGPITHELEGTPFRGNYHWEQERTDRTRGAGQITYKLEGTPFRGNYHWEEGQSKRTPSGPVTITYPLQGTPTRGNYPW